MATPDLGVVEERPQDLRRCADGKGIAAPLVHKRSTAAKARHVMKGLLREQPDACTAAFLDAVDQVLLCWKREPAPTPATN